MVVRGVTEYIQRHPDVGRRVGTLDPRDGLPLAQRCARCGHHFTPAQVQAEYRRLLRADALDEADSFGIPALAGQTISAAAPHWCCPPDGVSFCCAR